MVRSAFLDGLPYTKTRLLIGLRGVDEARDAEFVRYASIDTVRVLAQRVDTWNYYCGQDDKPADLDDHHGIRRQRGVCGGMGKVVIEAPDDMLDRLFALLDAYGDFLHYNAPAPTGLRTVEESAQQTPSRSRSAQRLDWLLDLLEEIALADPRKIDPYVAAVGVTIQYEDLINRTGHGLSSQGSVLTAEAVRQLCCDADIHRIVVKGQSEILDYGRGERLFNRILRRAIRFRHGHVCAARGCGRRITKIHHLEHFERGGETTIGNGIPLCSYHHHLVHEGGWQIRWDAATGVTRLEGPKGQLLETTASFLSAA